MAAGQPLNATFFAFRKRERGGVLLSTTIAYIVMAAVLMAAFVALNLGPIMQVASWYGGTIQQAMQGNSGPPDMTGLMSSFMALSGAYTLFLFCIYVLLAAYEAACLRWLVRGERGGVFGLSLGGDTWRVWLGYWIWLLLLIGFYILCVVVMMIAGVGAFGTFATATEKAPANGGAAVLIMFAAMLGIIALCAYIGTRLAPGAATSVISKRFAMFDAWKVTNGRFWALFGAFVLLWLLYFLAIIVVEIIIGVVMGATMAGAIAGAGQGGDPSAMLSSLMSPPMLIMIALIYVGILAIAMTFCIAMFGVNARAVIAAAEEGKLPGVTPPQAEVFS